MAGAQRRRQGAGSDLSERRPTPGQVLLLGLRRPAEGVGAKSLSVPGALGKASTLYLMTRGQIFERKPDQSMQISRRRVCLSKSVMASAHRLMFFWDTHARENRNAVWECAPFVAAVVSTNYMHLPCAAFLQELRKNRR